MSKNHTFLRFAEGRGGEEPGMSKSEESGLFEFHDSACTTRICMALYDLHDEVFGLMRLHLHLHLRSCTCTRFELMCGHVTTR